PHKNRSGKQVNKMDQRTHARAEGPAMISDNAPFPNGEICVVTGATSGIGRATALGLARLGAKVVIVARNPARAAAVVAEIATIPGALAAEAVLADLTEMKEVRRAAEEISTRFDRVDVLVNNA